MELARDPAVRTALYRPLATGTKDEKIGIAGVLARSGDKESLTELRKLSNDPDTDVQKEVLRAIRTLQSQGGIGYEELSGADGNPPHENYLAFFCFCWPTRTLKCSTLASWNAL